MECNVYGSFRQQNGQPKKGPLRKKVVRSQQLRYLPFSMLVCAGDYIITPLEPISNEFYVTAILAYNGELMAAKLKLRAAERMFSRAAKSNTQCEEFANFQTQFKLFDTQLNNSGMIHVYVDDVRRAKALA